MPRVLQAFEDTRDMRVIHAPGIGADALDFARSVVARNPDHAAAYVIDICRAEGALWVLETNCLDAAGLHAANIPALVDAIEALGAV